VVFLTAFILPLVVVFIGASLRLESPAFGTAPLSIAAIIFLGSLFMLFTRLELKAEGDRFSLVVRLFQTPIIQRDILGSSWHAITRTGNSLDSSSNDRIFCRVEVADADGNRRLVLGEFLAFLYRVECL
jgi:hypothetical protein